MKSFEEIAVEISLLFLATPYGVIMRHGKTLAEHIQEALKEAEARGRSAALPSPEQIKKRLNDSYEPFSEERAVCVEIISWIGANMKPAPTFKIERIEGPIKVEGDWEAYTPTSETRRALEVADEYTPSGIKTPETGETIPERVSLPSEETIHAASFDYTTENGGNQQDRLTFRAGVDWLKANLKAPIQAVPSEEKCVLTADEAKAMHDYIAHLEKKCVALKATLKAELRDLQTTKPQALKVLSDEEMEKAIIYELGGIEGIATTEEELEIMRRIWRAAEARLLKGAE